MIAEMEKTEEVEETGGSGDYCEAIPHEVVYDILTRLPVQSLCRLQSVSTLWNSTSDDPSFVDTHFYRSLTGPDSHTLLISFTNGIKSERRIFSARIKPIQTLRDQFLSIRGGPVGRLVSQSLRGLICYQVGGRIRICNPTTGKSINLPPSPSTETPPPEWELDGTWNWFGFDPVRNQHKVLNTRILLSSETQYGIVWMFENWVYSVRGGSSSNKWRRIDRAPLCLPFSTDSDSLCVNGFIYYMGSMEIEEDGLESVAIVAFDVAQELFHVIQIPPDTVIQIPPDANNKWLALMELDGQLALVDHEGLRSGRDLEIWILTEGTQDWVKKKSVVFPQNWDKITKHHKDLKLAGTTQHGEMIFIPLPLDKPVYVFCYDMKRNSVRVRICGMSEHVSHLDDDEVVMFNHVESIQSFARF